jgi:hypothetical protein
MLTPFKRRRIAGVGAGAAAILASLGLAAGPAAATTTTPANSILVGSGSYTTYFMMQNLDRLFSDSQGCQVFNEVSGGAQPLDYSCATAAPDYVAPVNLPPGQGMNPYNDAGVQEVAVGSSTGLAQLKFQGSNVASGQWSTAPAPISFARSSRALKGSDPAGENFVAYAKDGLDWTTFTQVAGSTTGIPSECGGAAAPDIELNFLQQIWNGTITNWAQLCADVAYYPATPTNAQYQTYSAENAPICVYAPQPGSGTASTWDTFMGFTAEAAINSFTPNTTAATWASSVGISGAFVNAGCTNGTTGASYGASHVIQENETKQLVAQGKTQLNTTHPTVVNLYSDTRDSIFPYSFGRFTADCKTGVAICDPAGFHLALGEIGNQLPTATNIIASDCGTGCFSGTPWADPRYVYNIYGNGDTSANVVPGTPATVNYVSEVGFICKPKTAYGPVTVSGRTTNQTYSIVDPNTGKTYLSEVQAAIKAAGFLSLPLQATEDQGTINYPAVNLLPSSGSALGAYSVFDPNYNATITPSANSTANLAQTNPSGYCKVFTTSS